MDDSLASRIDAAIRKLAGTGYMANAAYRELLEIGVAALPALIDALDDPAKRLRVFHVLRGLGPAAAPAIAKLLLVCRKDCQFVDIFYSEESSVAMQALLAIGPAAVEPLLDGLQSASDEEYRFYQWTLCQLPPEAVVPKLIGSLCEVDGNFRLRLLSVVSSIGMQAAEAIPIVVLLLQGTAADVRAAAAQALGSIGEPAVASLWPLVDSPSVDAAVASIQALGHIGERSGHNSIAHGGEDLLSLFQRKLNAPARRVQAAAALALHRVANHRVEWALHSALSPSYGRAEVNETCDILCDLIGFHRPRGIDRFAQSTLRDFVREPETHFAVRRAAATVLLDIGDAKSMERALPIVSQGLRDAEDPYYLDYMRAAHGAGVRAAALIPDIIVHLRLSGTERRVAALSALGGIGVATREALEAILPFLDHENRRLASVATQVLGMFGIVPTYVVEALIRQLERGWNEFEVAVTLGKIGPPAAAAVPALVTAAGRSSEREGWFAEALGNIGTPEAIAELKAMYEQVTVDYGEWVSAAAQLERLGVTVERPGTPADYGRTIPVDERPSDPEITGETDYGGPMDTQPH